MRVALLLLLAACASKAEPAPAKLDVPIDATPPLLARYQQLVVVSVDGWDGVKAELRRYDRDGQAWREVGAPIAAVIGSAGAAWGLGLHPQAATKREGDLRSPAGAFLLGKAHDAPFPAAWRCVDDPASSHYNQVLDGDSVPVDWTSAEDMHIPAYAKLVEVAHNPTREPGAGSCIFLHIWDGPDDDGTAGCTAMAEPDLAALIAWLRPGAIYVLLPRAERDALASSWGLP